LGQQRPHRAIDSRLIAADNRLPQLAVPIIDFYERYATANAEGIAGA
jgi:hypothetical protein